MRQREREGERVREREKEKANGPNGERRGRKMKRSQLDAPPRSGDHTSLSTKREKSESKMMAGWR